MAVNYGQGSTARVIDCVTGKQRSLLEGHSAWIGSADVSPDKLRVATASADRTARIWSAESGEALHVLDGHGAEVDYVAFSPDGRRAVTGARDWHGRIWDVERGTELARFATKGWVWAPRFCCDGERVISGVDGWVHVWNAGDAAFLRTYAGHRTAVYFSWARPESTWVLSTSIDNACLVWDTNSLETIASLQGLDGEITAAAFSTGGRAVATLDRQGTVRAWSLPDGAPLLAVRAGVRGPARLSFSPGGEDVVATIAGRACRRWPLSPLPEALARRPRDLSTWERERFGIGDAEERERLRKSELERTAEAEWMVLSRMWSTDRTNLRARHEFLEGTRRLVEASLTMSDSQAALDIASRAREWDGGRDPVIAWSFAAAHANGGDLAEGVRWFDTGWRMPRAQAGFTVEAALFADWCRRLAPDAVCCAAVDLLLARRATLVTQADQVRFWRGSRGAIPGRAWTGIAFADEDWEEGPGPIGFGDARCRTKLDDMPGKYTSLLVRSRFQVADPDALRCLRASVHTRDGCVVWVNGREVARLRQFAPGRQLRLGADSEHAHRPAAPREAAEMVIDPDWLRPGENVLCLSSSTASLSDPSLLLAVEIEGEPRVDPARDQELLAEFREAASGQDRKLEERYFEGSVLSRSGRHGEAVEALRAAYTLAPEPLVVSRLAESLRALGKDEEAARLLEALIEQGPAVAEDDPQILLAAAARIAGRPDHTLEPYVRAACWARRAAELGPSNPAAHAVLGAACFRAALPARAARAFEKLEAELSLAAVRDAIAVLRGEEQRQPHAAAGEPSPQVEAAIQALVAPWW